MPPIFIRDNFPEGLDISPHLLILRSGSDDWTPGKVWSLLHSPTNPWKNIQSEDFSLPKLVEPKNGVPNFGSSEETFWFFFRTENLLDKKTKTIIKIRYPLLDEVDFFFLDPGGISSLGASQSVGASFSSQSLGASQSSGSFGSSQSVPFPKQDSLSEKGVEVSLFQSMSGRAVPISEREIYYRGSAFLMELEPLAKSGFLIRVRTRSALTFPADLWTVRGFHESVMKEQMIQGIFFGTILVMIFYNLFLYFSLRDRGYLYYVLYLFFASFLFQLAMNGYLGVFFFGSDNFVQMELHNTIYILSLVFVFPLVRYVLNFRELLPWMDRLCKGFFYFSCFALVLDLFLPYQTVNQAMDIFAMIAIVTVMYACFLIMKKKYRPGYYFFFAFLFVMLGGLLSLFKYMGVLPVNFFTENTYQMGMGLEVILMGFALADRIRVMEKQKAQDFQRIQGYESELEIARRLQESTLPLSCPYIEGLEIAARYKPMSFVGGDFFDFQVTENGLIVFIADVTGHGIPAAFEAAMLKIAFSAEKESGKSPAEMLSGMNRLLIQSSNNQLLTATLAYIDLKNFRMTLSNAGHPATILYRKSRDQIQELRPKGSLMGFFERMEIANLDLDLQSGDRILFYTDGILEASRLGDGEAFGEERFHAVVSQCQTLNCDDSANAILAQVAFWSGKDSPDDDISLIIIDVN